MYEWKHYFIIYISYAFVMITLAQCMYLHLCLFNTPNNYMSVELESEVDVS